MLPGVTMLGEPLTRPLGPRTAKTLESAFGMRTVGDLLRHYPRRYYTRGELTELSSLREGDHVTVLARVHMASEIPLPPTPGKGRRSRLEVIVTDDRDKLTLTFFSGIGMYRRKLVPGVGGMFAGTLSTCRPRRRLVHPECQTRRPPRSAARPVPPGGPRRRATRPPAPPPSWTRGCRARPRPAGPRWGRASRATWPARPRRRRCGRARWARA